MNPSKRAAQGGEYIPFASSNICFTSMTLAISNHSFTEPKWLIFCTSCCLTNHREKSCTSFPIPCPKERVKQWKMENCYKTGGSVLHLCSSTFLHIFVHKSPILLYTLASSNPGWESRRRQRHLGSEEGPCEFQGKMDKFWRNHTQRGSFALKLI